LGLFYSQELASIIYFFLSWQYAIKQLKKQKGFWARAPATEIPQAAAGLLGHRAPLRGGPDFPRHVSRVLICFCLLVCFVTPRRPRPSSRRCGADGAGGEARRPIVAQILAKKIPVSGVLRVLAPA